MRIVSGIKNLLMAAAAVAALGLYSTTALAHSSMTASSPGNESVVVSPETLELTFNEGIRMLRLSLVHGASHNIEFGFQPSTETATTVSYELPMLMMGEHTVNWTVIGSDGHPVNGSFKFTVSADGEAATVQSNSDAGHHHH
ncbi:MAG: copper resistance protein CopC [Gammaproteobacteria bacterium]|nr:copper resistance protein CopC [Gammaproteobacteria bacterium]